MMLKYLWIVVCINRRFPASFSIQISYLSATKKAAANTESESKYRTLHLCRRYSRNCRHISSIYSRFFQTAVAFGHSASIKHFLIYIQFMQMKEFYSCVQRANRHYYYEAVPIYKLNCRCTWCSIHCQPTFCVCVRQCVR